ncbi:hypothetical protein [Desulfobacula sp.]
MKNKNLIYQINLVILVCLLVFVGENKTLSAKENIKTIAILPFQVNAQGKLLHIRKGIDKMLYSRLFWQDNVMVISGEKLKKSLSGMDTNSAANWIQKIARLTNSNFVLAGAITKLGGSFSIDVQVYDIENKRYMAFFEQSQKWDDLINKVNRIAASINKKVFERSTMTWEKMEQEKQAYLAEQKRKNPEYMMKTPGWQNTEKSPGWKIWKYLF